MGRLFLCFLAIVPFLLLTQVSPLQAVPPSSCSSTLKEDEHQHLNSSGVVHFTLHHPRSPGSPAPYLASLPFSAVLTLDDARVRSLTARLSNTTTTRPRRPAAAVPLSPGSSVGVGNYVTRVALGTPPKPFVMVVDTGSSLSWLQCSPCHLSCHPQVGAVFDPAASGSYRPVPCSTPECDSLRSATLNPSSCSVSNVCIYETSYGDGSFSVGYLGKDSLFLGAARGGRTLSDFVFGCGQDNEGIFGMSAGLLGLARNKLSLLAQLAPKVGSSSFSYCLPTMASAAGGFLSIGPYDPAQFAFTPMAKSSLDETFYFIRLTSVAVGGKALRVAASPYAATPTIIDSGTVITRLPAEVYEALSKAIAAALKKHRRAPAYSILGTCFRGSMKGMAVPAVDMVFRGGARLKLATRNVMIDVDGGTVTCLAFAPAERVAIIGNRQQQTFRVVYDAAKSRIGFAAGGCS